MRKLFTIISCLIATISFVAFLVNLSTIISTRNWIKMEAVVTSILLPEGVVCGDFTDNNGVEHVDQSLFSDFKFQQIRALKVVKQETINKNIGKKITILYNDANGRIINYDNLLIETITYLIVSLLLAILLYLVWRNRKEKLNYLNNSQNK